MTKIRDGDDSNQGRGCRKSVAGMTPASRSNFLTRIPSSPQQGAAQALTAAGYRNVLEYVEGKKDWQEAGYPLVGSKVGATLALTD